MTTLSLQSLSPNIELSIHLQIGQFCTLGASPAADFHVNAQNVDPVHCRIGCRSNCGFIECLADDGQIIVNGVQRSRSRLADGDSLQIGAVKIQVGISSKKQAKREFDISFSDEQAPTTQISGALKRRRRSTPDDDDFVTATPSITPEPEATLDNDLASTESHSSAESQSLDSSTQPPGKLTDQQSELSSQGELSDNSPNANISPNANPEDSRAEASASESHLKPVQPGRPVFEFDSTDPTSAPLSLEDLETLASQDSLPGQQSLEDLLDQGTDANVEPESTETISAGGKPLGDDSELGKYWKHVGGDAMGVLQDLVSTGTGLNVYTISRGEVVKIEVSEMLTQCQARTGSHTFLMSQLSANELGTATRQKKWSGRLGHPQAINMFLALSPKRISDEFFKMVAACVLVYENEVEVFRGFDASEL